MLPFFRGMCAEQDIIFSNLLSNRVFIFTKYISKIVHRFQIIACLQDFDCEFAIFLLFSCQFPLRQGNQFEALFLHILYPQWRTHAPLVVQCIPLPLGSIADLAAMMMHFSFIENIHYVAFCLSIVCLCAKQHTELQ